MAQESLWKTFNISWNYIWAYEILKEPGNNTHKTNEPV